MEETVLLECSYTFYFCKSIETFFMPGGRGAALKGEFFACRARFMIQRILGTRGAAVPNSAVLLSRNIIPTIDLLEAKGSEFNDMLLMTDLSSVIKPSSSLMCTSDLNTMKLFSLSADHA